MIVVDSSDLRVERVAVPVGHRFSLLPRIYVEEGATDDWAQMHELHYKAGDLAIGARYFRCKLDDQLIGVGVMTYPNILNAGRNAAMPHMRPNQNGRDTKLMNRHRTVTMNKTHCVNSRVVLDTMFRGAGIGYRMQNMMMRMSGRRHVEFQSSMSKFNPFAAKAGVKFTAPRRAAAYEKGLALFMRWFESPPNDYSAIMGEIAAMPEAVRAKCLSELKASYYKWSAMEKSGDNRANGTSRVDAMETGYLLKQLQQLTLASPIYGVYENPEYDPAKGATRALPPRIPVLAFDNQPTDQPLRLDLLQTH
jgi:ABC-type ATPase with predicted acetyltransferase domain